MKMKSVRYLVLAAAMLLLAPVAAGCGGGGQATVTECGSTTIQPLAEKLAAAFMVDYPDVKVTISGGGSSAGIKSAAEGVVDIGAASRALSPSEAAAVTPLVIAYDAIAMVAHPSNAVSGLTTQDLRDIYAGEITNWNQVGGPDILIHVVAREEGSGTRDAFEEMIMGEGRVSREAILQPSNGAVRTLVAGDTAAIGFISLGYVDDTIKPLAIDGVAPSIQSAVSGSYRVVRPLLFVTKKTPSGNIKTFLDFCLSPEGQAIVAEDYIPVN